MGEAAHVDGNEVLVSWLPLYHDMGLIGAWFAPLYWGFPLVVMSPLTFLARPLRWLEAIQSYRGTITAAPNFAYERCAHIPPDSQPAGLNLASLRLAFNGAEPVHAETMRRFAARFAADGLDPHALTPVYGLAENTVALAFPAGPRPHDRADLPRPLRRCARSGAGCRRRRRRARGGVMRPRTARSSDPDRGRCRRVAAAAAHRQDRVPRPVGDPRLLPQPRTERAAVRRRLA